MLTSATVLLDATPSLFYPLRLVVLVVVMVSTRGHALRKPLGNGGGHRLDVCGAEGDEERVERLERLPVEPGCGSRVLDLARGIQILSRSE